MCCRGNGPSVVNSISVVKPFASTTAVFEIDSHGHPGVVSWLVPEANLIRIRLLYNNSCLGAPRPIGSCPLNHCKLQ
ncbi:hypothetical protein N7510_010405 [Penicillium lagena]|uniref:uncharacterized protein n=1 Tax=Penicillium lagena TaxID=94218 RepID=UPI002541F63D|nr:uncharacterized protein N7510_010405 [Penicillium lagena]KAJ5605251.1 hypothetical protein N7510_010405 [Penicillium lagena]